jgi:hypothetical protein
MQTENQWRDKAIIPWLESLAKQKYPIYWFIKEAGAIRGIPDLIICVDGLFVAWELKRSRDEAEKSSGRIVLQRYTCLRIQRAGGQAEIVHPENLEEMKQKILQRLIPTQLHLALSP